MLQLLLQGQNGWEEEAEALRIRRNKEMVLNLTELTNQGLV
jgi:hypothetical protein